MDEGHVIAESPFESPLTRGAAPARPAAFVLDVYRTDEHWVVHAELAGVNPGSIEITLTATGVLSLSAYRSDREDEQLRWTAHERPTGPLRRRIQLGPGLDPDTVQATQVTASSR